MSDEKNVQRVAKCRAKLCRVELLFKPEEHEAIKKAAGDQPLAAYIKTAVREKMEREGR